MNTKKGGLNLSGFLTANPMAKYSDCPWSEGASCNNDLTTQTNNSNAYLSANKLNLMLRFSPNSSLALHSSATESDATSSSTSSISAINNSSSSLSLSPAAERNPLRSSFKPIHQASNHLLQLQKEIKEEEEEIFADINSLINSHSNLYSNTDDEDDEANEEEEDVNLDDEERYSTFNHLHSHNNKNVIRNSYHNSLDERLFTNDSDDLNDYQSHSADDVATHDYQNESTEGGGGGGSTGEEQLEPKMPRHQSVNDNDYLRRNSSHYLSEQLDEDLHEQMEHENDHQFMDDETFSAFADPSDQQNYQALQAVIQQVTSNLPKPCVFFLEGNCRRSDCKYSHDLSNITCKYWIEGFCFKGELCPFLHSYNSQNDSQDPSLLDEDGLSSLAKKDLIPTFVIESEADFPSLPLDAPANSLEDNTKSSINTDAVATTIKNQILSSNPAVIFKTVKKKRKRG